MSILDRLGLGYLAGNSFPQSPAEVMRYQQGLQQYYGKSPITTHCVHGDDCPKCKEDKLRVTIELKKIEREEERKKEDYKIRCKAYMEKFHKLRIR